MCERRQITPGFIIQRINTPSEEHEGYTNKQTKTRGEVIGDMSAETVLTVSLGFDRPTKKKD